MKYRQLYSISILILVLALLLGSVLVTNAAPLGQTAENVELIGTYSDTIRGEGVVVRGNYVYMGAGGAFQVIDVSDPANPVAADYVPNTDVNNLDLENNRAYVAAGYSGLRIINISNPFSIFEEGHFFAPWSVLGVDAVGNYAYIAAMYAGLRIINVSNPAAPIETGLLETPSAFAYDVAVSGNYAYLANDQEGVKVINISDPTNPVEENRISTNYLAQGITISGSYAYIADASAGLTILDISNPPAISIIGFLDLPGQAADVAVQGDYAYVTARMDGVRVVDVSDPGNPTEIGFYDIPAWTHGVAADANYFYLSSRGIPLYILRYGDTLPPTPTPTVTTTPDSEPPIDGELGAEDDARAQAPLCADLSGMTNPIVRADILGGTVTDGSVFCRVLAENGTFINSPADIGNQAVLDQGVIHAVDVFGLTHGSESVTQFNSSVKVCLQGSGRLLYLDATLSPRIPSWLTTNYEGGFTCGLIYHAGIVVLVP